MLQIRAAHLICLAAVLPICCPSLMLWSLLQAGEIAAQAKQRIAEAVRYGKETVDQTAHQVMRCDAMPAIVQCCS